MDPNGGPGNFRLGPFDEQSRAAETGKVGDGKIFVLNLESALRVRTGETGPEAI